MNYGYLAAFVVLYALTYVPMFAADRFDSGATKGTLFAIDAVLTVAAYIFLWYAFPTTWTSLFAVLGMFVIALMAGRIMRTHGYYSYGIGRPDDTL